MAKRPITDDLRNEWAALAQQHVLAALMAVRAWRPHELAFHGGTSLHFSWASPRFSEDLDFLLDQAAAEDLPGLMAKVEARMREQFLVVDPKLHVEIRNKSSKLDRMGNFHVVVTHDDVLGRAMVKAEFWRVDRDYLSRYPTEFRQPVRPGDMVARTTVLVPAAALTASIADKITALANRPYLKWRDLFDVWWVTTQTRGVPAAPGRILAPSVIEQYLHNRTGYAQRDGGVGSDMKALQAFLDMDTATLVKQADADLKPFLPRDYWDRLGPSGVQQIVEHSRALVAEVVDALRGMADSEEDAEPSEPPKRERQQG